VEIPPSLDNKQLRRNLSGWLEDRGGGGRGEVIGQSEAAQATPATQTDWEQSHTPTNITNREFDFNIAILKLEQGGAELCQAQFKSGLAIQ
jgi:hypothetical protein